MQALDPLPDPVAYARALSDDELRAYREIYGRGIGRLQSQAGPWK